MDRLLVDRIGGAREAHALDRFARERGITDPAEAYRRLAKEILEHNHVALGLPNRPEIKHAGTRPAYVSGGWWLVHCAQPKPDGTWGEGCRNCPHADPEAKLAICLDCGREYDVEFPPDCTDAEAALLARPDPRTRSYFWHKTHPLHLSGGKPETAERLHRENADHGIKRPRRKGA